MVTSTLTTPDPYHLPGYLGYIPQFKFRIGGTYGKTTHSLMESDNRGNKFLRESPKIVTFERMNCTSQEGWDNQKLQGSMIPGYTGYIPKGQHYFGERYAQSCNRAIDSFQKDLNTKETQSLEFSRRPQVSMPKLGKSVPFPAKAKVYGTSPYKLPAGHEEKYFISGYTGFVPRAREQLAKGYPVITTAALTIHAREQDRLNGRAVSRSADSGLSRAYTAPSRIYQEKSGLVPNYTGHVPAMKFKYGKTYGNTTVGAMNKTL